MVVQNNSGGIIGKFPENEQNFLKISWNRWGLENRSHVYSDELLSHFLSCLKITLRKRIMNNVDLTTQT